MARVAAIVVSAGMGNRMGGDKTFLNLCGRPLIAWSVDVLEKNKYISQIILVLQKTKLNQGGELRSRHQWSKVTGICAGGNLRQDSVRNGLDAVNDCELVLIHDGARPFLTNKLIDDGIEAVRETGAAAAAIEVKDTIKQIDDSGIVIRTLPRNSLRSAQTPQVFRTDVLRKAYQMLAGEATDDAGIVERAGYRVKLYAGDYENIKVTTPEDMTLAAIIAGGR